MFPPLHFIDCHDVHPPLLFLPPTIAKPFSSMGERGTTANELSYVTQALFTRCVERRARARCYDILL